MDIKKIFGNNIKYYRYKKNYTQEKFAELTNSNTTYISDVENGKYSVSFDKIQIFAKVLNVEIYLLFVNQNDINELPKRVNMQK